MIRHAGRLFLIALLMAGLVSSASAQIEDNLSAYDEDTVEGYLKPLQGALGQALNTSFYSTAAIPQSGFHARLDLKLMSVFLKDSDATFGATPGEEFVTLPGQGPVEVSTVVGPGSSTSIPGAGGTQFVFPGGVDLSSLSLVVPQLTVGSLKGTELVLRWLAAPTNEPEIGTVSTFGIGGRHSISQYLAASPVDLAGAFFYQKFDVESDLIKVSTWSIAAQSSTDLLPFLRVLAALSYDSVSMSTSYTNKSGSEDQDVTTDFDTEGSLHLSLGAYLGLGPVGVQISGDLASRAGIGLSIGGGF